MVNNPLNILYVEDSETDFELMMRSLKKEGLIAHTKQVQSLEKFSENLSDKIDLVISDYNLPGFTGLDVIKLFTKSRFDIPFILVSSNIGEEKAVEALKLGATDYLLKDHANKLPHVIKRALNEQKTKQQQEEQKAQLRTINQELDTLVYRIAHDLRGPICSLEGLINVLESEPIKDWKSLVDEQFKKSYHTIESLTNLVQIKKHKLEKQHFSVEELLNPVIKKLNLEEFIVISNPDYLLKTDGVFIRKALFEVLKNALNNSGKKPLKIEVTATKNENNANEISIKDYGTGIEEKQLSHALDLFYRGTEQYTGTGIGLYLSKAIIEKLRGKLSLTSNYGEWTNILITLPL